ncbi:MAG TPA: VOC family protein [Clostridia bacterium]|nr:VOC family protein [Clostridia bacterium]
MKIEHLALQVSDPVKMADWYGRHLGFSVARSGGGPAHARFLLEKAGTVMLEIYHNPEVLVPDYKSLDPQMLHLAFWSADPEIDRDRLVSEGATVANHFASNDAGDQFVMLRDPWGLPIQLVKRAVPMLH